MHIDMRHPTLLLALVAALAVACTPEQDTEQDPTTGDDVGAESDAGAIDEDAGGADEDAGGEDGTGGEPLTDLPTTVGTDERPARIYFPPDYAGEPVPLVFLLHGYSANSSAQDFYFGLRRLVSRKRFIYVLPEGTKDGQGNQHWNATDACCAFLNKSIDDSGYLRGIIDELSEDYAVSGVWFMGHSNGGFMSYRMACEHADVVRGALSLAGAANATTSECNPSQPVRIIQVHGTDDATILYDGGQLFGNAYPSAEESASIWADYNGCDETSTDADPLDLMPAEGAETTRKVWGGCDDGGAAELWTIPTGPHIPEFENGFGETFYDELVK